jgi:hypothetical protein
MPYEEILHTLARTETGGDSNLQKFLQIEPNSHTPGNSTDACRLSSRDVGYNWVLVCRPGVWDYIGVFRCMMHDLW